MTPRVNFTAPGDDMVIRPHSALMAAVAEDDAGHQAMTETQPEPEQEQPVAGQTTMMDWRREFPTNIHIVLES